MQRRTLIDRTLLFESFETINNKPDFILGFRTYSFWKVCKNHKHNIGIWWSRVYTYQQEVFNATSHWRWSEETSKQRKSNDTFCALKKYIYLITRIKIALFFNDIWRKNDNLIYLYIQRVSVPLPWFDRICVVMHNFRI